MEVVTVPGEVVGPLVGPLVAEVLSPLVVAETLDTLAGVSVKVR